MEETKREGLGAGPNRDPRLLIFAAHVVVG